MSCVGSGGLGLGVEDVDEDRSSVVVVEAISLVVEEASVEVSVMVGEFGEETSSVEDTDALAVISLDAEEDVSEETTVEEDDELTASGVTVGSDEIGVILLDVSAELYDVDDISVEDEDDVGSTEEVTMTNDALCWVGEGAALEEDTALQSPNSFWQVSEALIIGWVVIVDGSTKILEGPAGVALQEPNLVWQPDPQYALLLPQYPYWEQQLPKTLPKQVWLEPTPHLPLVEVFGFEGVGEGDDVGGCFDGEGDVEQEPKPDWHPLEI
ncbi:unnamed protein product [Alternaria alternata]